MTLLPKFNASDLATALVTADVIDRTAADRAVSASGQTGTGLDRTLLQLGLAAEDAIYRTLAGILDVPFLPDPRADPDFLGSLPLSLEFLTRAEILPLGDEHGALHLATSNLAAEEELRSIGFRLKREVRVSISPPSAIRAGLGLAARSAAPQPSMAAEADVERLRALANDGPIIKSVSDLISAAVDAKASDIHIEAMETGARVRFRVDGRLSTDRVIPDADRAAVTSRLKVMADLNISEKRRPQDGRAQVTVKGKAVDLRMSTLPTQFGESIVLRILDRSRVALDWHSLGFTSDQIDGIERIIHQPNGVHDPNGIFLVAGPTGSGKTTTLYTALSRINSDERKIITVEDPIEYALEGVNQTQVEPQIDMTFARALRAILRQDPNVVMVGEIRDAETAEIAVRAALVGRLVLSTIHTNDSISTVDRLVDLGIPRYLIAATLRGVLSQRLVQRADGEGRRAVSELFVVDERLAQAISDGRPTADIRQIAERSGFVPMEKSLVTLPPSSKG